MPRRKYPVKKGPSKRRITFPFKKKKEGNQKSKGATKVFYAGIHFQSKLEVTCYKYGKEELGYPLQYESYITTVIPSLEPKCFFYSCIPKSKDFFKRTTLMYLPGKVQKTSYSPDFYLQLKNKSGEDVYIWIETKGAATPEYLLKRKLFLAIISSKFGNKAYFFEPHTGIQIKQCFEIIKTL